MNVPNSGDMSMLTDNEYSRCESMLPATSISQLNLGGYAKLSNAIKGVRYNPDTSNRNESMLSGNDTSQQSIIGE